MRWLSRALFSRHDSLLVGILLCVGMAACGTGIEVTEHVTDKDVRKVIEQSPRQPMTVTIEPYTDALSSWRPGKKFWVADDQVKQLFAYHHEYDKDTLRLAGRVLQYVSHKTGGLFLDDERYVEIALLDTVTGNTYTCRAGKAADVDRPGFSIPMLIDLDMVKHMAHQVVGKDFHILTSIWYDRQTEQMVDGRHYIKVHIDSVLPGNAVLPLRVLFTTVDTGERAMVWMSDKNSTMHGRDFDALFVAIDPHLAHPEIGNEMWELITRSQLKVGMTKDECRLSVGTPKRINEIPDQGGMREYWYYDGGSYLYFVDGLLSQFRR